MSDWGQPLPLPTPYSYMAWLPTFQLMHDHRTMLMLHNNMQTKDLIKGSKVNIQCNYRDHLRSLVGNIMMTSSSRSALITFTLTTFFIAFLHVDHGAEILQTQMSFMWHHIYRAISKTGEKPEYQNEVQDEVYWLACYLSVSSEWLWWLYPNSQSWGLFSEPESSDPEPH